jgi:hypothetical protein
VSQLTSEVNLKPRQSKTTIFKVTPEMLMLFDEDGQQTLEPGKFRLTAGGCSPGFLGEALGAPHPVSEEFVIS